MRVNLSLDYFFVTQLIGVHYKNIKKYVSS